MAEDVLYIGIDLGTFRSVMVSSGNHEEEELTVIGTPKDLIARNFLKRDVLFGEEALKNRLALNLFRPLELGVIKDTPEDRQFIAHFITHLIGLADPEEHDRVVAVIGAPAEASHVDKTAIFDAAAGSVNAAMIISEPFAVAYALDMIEHTLVIDIGAGTTDLCRVYGTIPGPGDQMHTGFAGDYVDAQIIKEVQSKYNGAQITKDMARRWKEQYSFVSTSTDWRMEIWVPTKTRLPSFAAVTSCTSLMSRRRFPCCRSAPISGPSSCAASSQTPGIPTNRSSCT